MCVVSLNNKKNARTFTFCNGLSILLTSFGLCKVHEGFAQKPCFL